MAESRTNMVTLLNVSMPYSETSTEYARVCPTEELTISYEPDTSEVRYICDDTSTTTILGRTLSLDLELQYEKDNRVIVLMNRLNLNPPVGSAANRDFLNFLKTDIVPGTETTTSATYFGFKQPCTMVPTSLGGSSTDPLGIGANISGRGNSIPGYIKVEVVNGKETYKFTTATTVPPVIEEPIYGKNDVGLTDQITGTGMNVESSGGTATVDIYTETGKLNTAPVDVTNGTWSYTPDTDILKSGTIYRIYAVQTYTPTGTNPTAIQSVPSMVTMFTTATSPTP